MTDADVAHDPELDPVALDPKDLDPKDPEPINLDPTGALPELQRSITFSQGEFSLILAVCNASSQQQRLVSALVQQLEAQQPPLKAQILTLPRSTTALYPTIATQLGEKSPDAVLVVGLEGVEDWEQLLTAANQIREEFRKFSFPLVLWLTDEGLNRLIRVASDLYGWATTVTFETPVPMMLAFLQQLIASVLTHVLNSRENVFLDNAALGLQPGSPRWIELHQTCQALQQQGIALPPELEAGLEFVLGRIADNSQPPARQHYQRSLELWQQLQNFQHCGHVQFYLGLWWRSYAIRPHVEAKPTLQQAAAYFQQAIASLEQANRSDLAAKLINFWAETLHRLQDWSGLEQVLQRAQALYQQYPDGFREARTNGFLAELALARSNWQEAKNQAQQAIDRLAQAEASLDVTVPEQQAFLDWVNGFHQGWFLFSLAKAQQQLGQAELAVQTLEQARKITKPQYDPDLYRSILAALQQGYFQQQQYLTAFHCKQEQQAIESRFGLRAFVGAGRLQPRQQVMNPALPTVHESEAEMAQEIAASGRAEDVKRLVTRIAEDRTKLTVIHGPSGVGKSSLIDAGLVPVLQRQRFETRRVDVVLQRVYGEWLRELARLLAELVAEERPTKPSPPSPLSQARERESMKSSSISQTRDVLTDSVELADGESTQMAAAVETVLQQLKDNGNRNRLTMLIFDQFEEFFFDCQMPDRRRQFYQFLQACLDIPYVKVILSLREDYLSYVLECERLIHQANQDSLLDDILKKDNRYYLGNFSITDAETVIQGLTADTRFHLDADLTQQLVQDLATGLGEVRPIELQIVGAQLQAEQIHTLKQYQQRGSKDDLVQRYLANVVADCGPEHESLAKLVLYLLTDERNTRPIKTRLELEQALRDLIPPSEQRETTLQAPLDLVLGILVGSGLVTLLPEAEPRYQLVHDYLAAFIRRQQADGLVADLKREKAQRQAAEEQQRQTQARLNRFFKINLAVAGICILALFGLSLATMRSARQAKEGVHALSSSSNALLSSHQDLEALIEAVRLGQQLKQTYGTQASKQAQTLIALEKVVYGVQEQNRLEGHRDTVNAASFSPDGKIIATASGDNTIKLWSRDGTLLKTLDGHTQTVYDVTFSPDGKLLASASFDGTVKLWSREGKLLQTLNGHQGWVYQVRFSPDGKTIASASADGTIKLWDRDGKLLKTLRGHTDGVLSVDFSSDGQTLISGSDDNTIKLWNFQGQLLKTLPGHEAGVKSVSFSPDGQTIASASSDRTIKLWSREGKLLDTLQGHGEIVRSVAWSPDGKRLVSASDDHTIRLWSKAGQLLQTLQGHSQAVWGVQFSPDGKTIASASRDNTVKLWDVSETVRRSLVGHDNAVFSVQFSPDGQTIATASSDNTVKLWNRDGSPRTTLSGYQNTVWEVSFSPIRAASPQGHGQTLATASDDGTIKLWHPDGTLIQTLKGHEGAVIGVSFSPDGQTLASGGQDGTIKLWTVQGKLLKTLTGHTNTVNKVRFSPDDQLLASASSDKTVKLWSRAGTLLQTLTGHEDTVYDVSFSPDSQALASASFDGTIKLWGRDGQLLRTIQAEIGKVVSVRFSPDGQSLAAAGDDGTVRVWNLQGNLLKVLWGHDARVQSISFSPDGKTLASGSSDKRVILWPLDQWTLDLDALLNRSCTWLADYLSHHPDMLANLNACQTPALLQRAAPALVTEAETLAQAEKVPEAVAKFRQALQWDASLKLDPEQRAKQLADQAKAQKLVEQGRQLVRQGKVEEAISNYKQAEAIAPDAIPAIAWSALCWRGSLFGYAEQLIDACNKAVNLDPQNGDYRDTRGLARALTGNLPGALEDFQAYVVWTDDAKSKAQRQAWIEALKKGQNPLTPKEVAALQATFKRYRQP